MSLLSAFKQLFSNVTPFGYVLPARPSPRVLEVDGRTIALGQLKAYVTNLDMYRTRGPGLPPERFSISPSNFHIEWPDGVQDLLFPAITIVPARAEYEEVSFPPFLLEDTWNVYGQGTVVQVACAWKEALMMEIHAEYSAERQAIKAAIETQMNPLEDMGGLRFKMPGYFGETCRFTMTSGEIMDSPDSAKNRRKCQIGLLLEHNVVRLVDAVTFRPMVTVNTNVDLVTGLPIQPPEQTTPFRP